MEKQFIKEGRRGQTSLKRAVVASLGDRISEEQTFQVHHLNNNKEDNTSDNLVLLSPQAHSDISGKTKRLETALKKGKLEDAAEIIDYIGEVIRNDAIPFKIFAGNLSKEDYIIKVIPELCKNLGFESISNELLKYIKEKNSLEDISENKNLSECDKQIKEDMSLELTPETINNETHYSGKYKDYNIKVYQGEDETWECKASINGIEKGYGVGKDISKAVINCVKEIRENENNTTLQESVNEEFEDEISTWAKEDYKSDKVVSRGDIDTFVKKAEDKGISFEDKEDAFNFYLDNIDKLKVMDLTGEPIIDECTSSKTINIQEELKKLDRKAFRDGTKFYDFKSLYEATKATKKDKRILIDLLNKEEDPEVIYQELLKIYKGNIPEFEWEIDENEDY